MECSICHKNILGPYYTDSWGNAAHAHHVVEYCRACGRIISQTSSFGKVTYSDGRVVCGHCYKHENPVQEVSQINQAYFNARKLLAEKGFDFPKNIKVSLVSQEVFAERSLPDTVLGVNTSQIGLIEQTHHVKVLYGLPFILCSGVIAHEILHIWQNMKRLAPEPMVCEGLCELGAGLIYKRANSPLGQHLFENIERNQIILYSNGFKTMRTLLEKKGWEAIRDFVRENSNMYSFTNL